MTSLDEQVGRYYGRWPQYAALGGCVAAISLGQMTDGWRRVALVAAGTIMVPVCVLGPAALQIAASFRGEVDEDPRPE